MGTVTGITRGKLSVSDTGGDVSVIDPISEYRKRWVRFRVMTLPKSGTYFFVELLPKLGIKWKKISHVADEDGKPALPEGARSLMTIRDPRGYFVSMTHWCDIQARRIQDGWDPVAMKMNMKPELVEDWLARDFDEKLRLLVIGDPKALFQPSSTSSTSIARMPT